MNWSWSDRDENRRRKSCDNNSSRRSSHPTAMRACSPLGPAPRNSIKSRARSAATLSMYNRYLISFIYTILQECKTYIYILFINNLYKLALLSLVDDCYKKSVSLNVRAFMWLDCSIRIFASLYHLLTTISYQRNAKKNLSMYYHN